MAQTDILEWLFGDQYTDQKKLEAEAARKEAAARAALEQQEAEEERMLSEEYPYDAGWDDHDVD